MSITLSDGFMKAIQNPIFSDWNHFSPETILGYWELCCRTVIEYEKETAIIPSEKRVGCLLEEMVRAKHRERKVLFDDFLRQHLNGKGGYSLWKSSDPEEGVTATYAALNQWRLDRQSGETSYYFSSSERLLEYGVRIVHEDMHNHQYLSEHNPKPYENDSLSPENKKALQLLTKLPEIFVHIIQEDFANYFLYRLRGLSDDERVLPFCAIQFPVSEEIRRIISDPKTLPYAKDESKEPAQYVVAFDKYLLIPQDEMLSKALEDYRQWTENMNVGFDRKGFIEKTTKQLADIAILPIKKFTLPEAAKILGAEVSDNPEDIWKGLYLGYRKDLEN